ncbi:ParB-like protein [Noviherbaspirillum galbum]|uniref:Chromosome partitioning protein ParB n=1 Tax=Noviherbaspirillum galbum TaxID=2709383 RepID=A0A6B3SY87_9BURK|nr:ParB-like protein [Noviherbaspirillum galbum]NEX62859.1 chromosome partitioning protein ParB [Noviherbaspirillum galbum]
MRLFRLIPCFLLASLSLLLTPAGAHAATPCSAATPVDGVCEIRIADLHPTQPNVGLIQVEERAARMKTGLDGAKLTASRPLPVVQGPDHGFYLTDGHHFVSTLLRVKASTVTARVIGRIGDKANFWRQMQDRHWVYLFDATGRPIKPSALPRRMDGLGDDPYRSLAGYAQSAGYFGRSDVYFAEFFWARYFGQHMDWRKVDRMNLLSSLQMAERLACAPEARKLPGYAGPCRNAN